jgi:hypothetical protein
MIKIQVAKQDEKGYPIVVEEWIEEPIPVSDWLHDYALRIVVPKSLIEQVRDILIFKIYFDIKGLPVEILENEIHLYCNEILENDQQTIDSLKPYGVRVEERC